MKLHKLLWNRFGTLVGLLCLGSTLAILPIGVSAVRAGDAAEALMSIDPLLVSGQPGAAKPTADVMPGMAAATDKDALQPGRPGVEVQPGVIVLNTRGYNYGPPPTAIDPAAMERESETP